MKKILSLVLVCVMMISALILTSCQDTYKNVESFVKEQLENFGVITRTTITEEEWLNTWNSENFTVNSSGNGLIVNVLRSGDKFKMEMFGEIFYIEKVNGKDLMIMKQDGVWYSAETDIVGVGFWDESTLNDVVGLNFVEKFDEFEYDAEKQAYVYSEGQFVAELKFENGVLVDGIISSTEDNISSKIEISNVGTTTVDIPEYTPYEGIIDGAGSTAPN